jgi:hypothetical protein
MTTKQVLPGRFDGTAPGAGLGSFGHAGWPPAKRLPDDYAEAVPE